MLPAPFGPRLSQSPFAVHSPPDVLPPEPFGHGYSAPVSTGTQTKQLWICTSCGFIYDPDDGDPDGGIPPGTPFDEIPDTWFCPVCGARKADFEPYED